MRYRLTISYRGAGYAGWQRQPNATAVQEVVEQALSELVSEPVHIVGAGRTDAGVHARGQVAHLDTVKAWATPALVAGTNHHLPDDVRILAARAVDPDFHARRSALAKEYRYRLSRAAVISPLESLFRVAAPAALDPRRAADAMRLVEGTHDFTAFAKSGGAHRDPHRTVYRAAVVESGDRLDLVFVGDGFLRGMVRALVGTVLEVGLESRSLESFEALLEGLPRSSAGPNAKARGLILERVFYEADRAALAGVVGPGPGELRPSAV